MSKKKDAPQTEPAEDQGVTIGDEVKPEPPAEAPEQTNPEPAADEASKAALETELAAEKDKFLRLAADYDNYKKRSMKERENIYSDVRSDTVKNFLPVYDNLSRALAQETKDEAYRKGVEMILRQMLEIMEKFGVVEIEAVGKQFDPLLHDALLHVEDDSAEEGIIVEELQKGFKMGDRVIRFASVKVAN